MKCNEIVHSLDEMNLSHLPKLERQHDTSGSHLYTVSSDCELRRGRVLSLSDLSSQNEGGYHYTRA